MSRKKGAVILLLKIKLFRNMLSWHIAHKVRFFCVSIILPSNVPVIPSHALYVILNFWLVIKNCVPGVWHDWIVASGWSHSPVNRKRFWYANCHTPSKLERQFTGTGFSEKSVIRFWSGLRLRQTSSGVGRSRPFGKLIQPAVIN